jgi:polyisoprenoid-binding protein YceI
VSKTNTFDGSISVVDDELQDATVEFVFDINAKDGKLEQFDSNLKLNDFIDTTQNPTVSFKSTSFQKVNSNINFLKGNLTINNITKVVELDVMLTGLETHDGSSKAIFEILGNINRKDFGLSYNAYNLNSGIVLGQDMDLTVNLEFTTHSNFN